MSQMSLLRGASQSIVDISMMSLARVTAMIGKRLTELSTPCFVVDVDIVKNNCEAMRQRCERLGLRLRPHMKTHKTLEVGEIATNGTKRCITVSTVAEAEFFADGGFDDILYACPFTVDKMDRLKNLASRLRLFHVLIDSMQGLTTLEKSPLDLNKKWSVWIKVDCGYQRAGIPWDDPRLVELASAVSRSASCSLAGIYAHEGQTYNSRNQQQIMNSTDQAIQRILQAAQMLKSNQIQCPDVASGSTPSCSRPPEIMSQLTEMHPGNYSFYDVQQSLIGSCELRDVATRVLTRVSGHYPHRNQLLVDAGFLALSHDGKGVVNGGKSCCIVDGHPHLNLVRMSQEGGIIEPGDGSTVDYDAYPVGSVLSLIPYHSCSTAAMHRFYYAHTEGRVSAVWTPCSGW